jgi:hypothetical protein
MSVVKYFQTGLVQCHWAHAALPTFLWDQLKIRPESFQRVEPGKQTVLEYHDNIDLTDPATLLYEAGYFTKRKKGNNWSFTLDFANNEVRYQFFKDLVQAEARKLKAGTLLETREMKEAIEEPIPDLNKFIAAASSVIRRLPFKFENEECFHFVLFVLMETCHLERLERPKHKIQEAEIDIVGETAHSFLVFELELRRTIKEGFDQAKENLAYFLKRGKNVLVAVLNFQQLNSQFSEKPGRKYLAEPILSGWKGELYSSDGELLRNYSEADSNVPGNGVPSSTEKTTMKMIGTT